MAATVLLKTRSLALRAAYLRAAARDLRAEACAARLARERSLLRSSTRRLIRLAQGGSDAPLGDGAGLPETREQRCPHCQSESVTPGGTVQAFGGLVKSTYRCDACDRLFLYVRKPNTLLGSISEGRAVAED